MNDITSKALSELGRNILSGRNTLISGQVDDLVFLAGRTDTLLNCIHRVAGPHFDTILYLNAVDGLQTLKGEPSTNTESDPVTEFRAQLDEQEGGSVLGIIEQAEFIAPATAQSERDRWNTAFLELALRRSRTAPAQLQAIVVIAADPSLVAPSIVGCGNVNLVEVGLPTRAERTTHIQCLVPDAQQDVVEPVARQTEGSSLDNISAMHRFVAATGRTPSLRSDWVDLFRSGDSVDHWVHLKAELPRIRKTLEHGVVGQPQAVSAAVSALAARAAGLSLDGNNSREGQPAVLFFTGPTGVGKTHLAKMIAEAMFGDHEKYHRFDMSGFRQSHSGERLLGAAPGYVGYEAGGQLTEAVRQQPNAVILFDEIEKAHPDVFMTLLSVIDDGSITDAQGRVAYFEDTTIIFTSNLGAGAIAELDDPDAATVHAVGREAVEDRFIELGQPELFGRLEIGIATFDALRLQHAPAIARSVLSQAAFTHGPELTIDNDAVDAHILAEFADPATRRYGGRGIRNSLRRDLQRLSLWIVENHPEAKTARLSYDSGHLTAAVDDLPAKAVTP